MLTYIGKGYSKKFTDNYDRIIDELNKGDATIELIAEPDDICAPRLCDKDDINCHCYNESIKHRDEKALEDMGYKIGNRLTLTENLIKSLRKAYKENTIRTACIGCEWKDLCDGISRDNFEGTKLK